MVLLFKKHLPYAVSAAFLAFSLSFCVMGVVELVLTPNQSKQNSSARNAYQKVEPIRTADSQAIINSGFFQLATAVEGSSGPTTESFSNFSLVGTITGPASIARAMIKKVSDNTLEIFKLGSDVWGYKLVRIENKKVYLKSGDQTQVLDMFAPKPDGSSSAGAPGAAGSVQKMTISRTDLMNKIQNNMDKLLQGLRAGPHREDGNITGFKIFALNQNSPLYELGIRPGDVIKRINGHPIDSTEKLYNYYQQLPKESKFLIDIQRGSSVTSLDYSITN